MTRTLNHRMAQWLTYAGTLPLLIVAAEMVAGRLPTGYIVWVASTYSAIIISFLAGMRNALN